MHASSTTKARRGGFTLLELLVVNVLLALLVILIAGAWRAFGPLCVEVIARGRIVNEANIAAQALYQDANGSIQGDALTNVGTSDGQSLQFHYGARQSDGSYPHNILYSLKTPQNPTSSTENLLARSLDGSPAITIARHVESAVATNISLSGSKTQVNLTLTFGYKLPKATSDISQSQYTFAVHN